MHDDSMPVHEPWIELIWRVIRRSLLVSLTLAILAFAVAWLIGWRTLDLIGQALMFAGLGSIAIGLLSVVGSWNIRTNYRYQYSRSASEVKIGERAGQDLRDVFSSYGFMITMLVGGILLILLGSYLPLVWSP